MKRDIYKYNNLKRILTKEFVYDLFRSKEFGNEKLELNQASKKVKEIAQKSEAVLTSNEKEELKKQIVSSIHNQKSKKLYYRRISSAASILILVVSTFLLVQYLSTSDIVTYANNFENSASDKNTHLYLGSKEEIAINSEEASIEHIGNSTYIRIDSGEEIHQELEINQVIYNTLFVPYGKKTKIVLSDNSTVWLNSGTKFIYPAKFSNNRREVFLEGEAVFDVSKNKEKPFVVRTNDIEVEVLGTVFNVSSYANDDFSSTALESGAVKINFKKSVFKSEKLTIIPGTVAVFNRNNKTITQQKEDVGKYLSWRYGILILEEEPLLNIITKLSRYHNIRIEVKDEKLANETFSGRLEFNQSAVQTLKTIAEIVDFELTVSNETITIYKN